jgi:hypothetical protein
MAVRSELVADGDAADVVLELRRGEVEPRRVATRIAIADARRVTRDQSIAAEAVEFHVEIFAAQQPMIRQTDLGAGTESKAGRGVAECEGIIGRLEGIDKVGRVALMGDRKATSQIGIPVSCIDTDTSEKGEQPVLLGLHVPGKCRAWIDRIRGRAVMRRTAQSRPVEAGFHAKNRWTRLIQVAELSACQSTGRVD